MKKIQILPKQVADKIAAGEVVDRPLSIVKELIENSIDAGSDAITIEIKNGGKSYIRVSDNGIGIDKEDVAVAFLRHATSKVATAEDLEGIETLGFRGEALASIAAVSRTELITKTADAKAGISVKIQGGEIVSQTDVGCPDGTTIVVSDLFYNTPARLKFMKADATESTLIIDFVSKMALAYANIKIRLINNGNILFSTSGKGNIQANILTIFGKDIGDGLIQYYGGMDNSGRVDIEVFVSPQSKTRTNRKYQIYFINGRYVNSKILDNAVVNAYKERIPDGRFPVVFIFYRVDPKSLDVNIHPNKKEVRFADEKQVWDFVTTMITKALETVNVIPNLQIKQEPQPLWAQPKEVSQSHQLEPSPANIDYSTFFAKKREEAGGSQAEIIEETQTEFAIEKEPNVDLDILNINITGAVFNTYITGYDAKYFYMIDQHAAHERIFYEQFLDQFTSSKKQSQSIMEAIIVEVTLAIKNNDNKITEYLEICGFEIDAFGPKAYKVSSIPSYMSIEEAIVFLNDFMDKVEESTDFEDQKKIDKIISNACKKAVKAHDKLDIKEMQGLLHSLAKTRNPYSCPHGRPVFLKLSQYEIEKMFKRV